MLEKRMTAEERKAAIVKAVLPLFARQGFANTTTRQLAEVAGVSEALLYKHFPSKESLYTEMQNCGCRGCDPALDKLTTLEPSTSTLVYIIYYIMRSNIVGRAREAMEWETRHRLLLNSCLEDGSFTRYLFQNRFSQCIHRIEACMDAALKSGDMVNAPASKHNLLMFSHHLAAMIATMHLPTKPAIDYKSSREELLKEATWFALRGLGLKDEAIQKYYSPRTLALFFGDQQI
jgi:AcrR family transcriptional regulator